MDIFSQIDFHTHAVHSGEDQSQGFTIPVMCNLADRKGIKYVLYTEHWTMPGQIDLFKKLRAEIEECRKKYEVKVLLSAEIDIIGPNGETAVDLDTAGEILDVVSVAHHCTVTAGQPPPDILKYAGEMFVKSAMDSRVRFILHPQIIGNIINENLLGRNFYREMLSVAKENDTAVECTSIRMLKRWIRYLTNGKNPDWWEKKLLKDYENFIRAVVESGVKFALGTDAHNEKMPDFLGGGPWFGETRETVALLRKYGADESKLWLPHLEAKFKGKWDKD
ncbi:MAG: hypothetical protein WC082_11750 [Victivallales bacterium]